MGVLDDRCSFAMRGSELDECVVECESPDGISASEYQTSVRAFSRTYSRIASDMAFLELTVVEEPSNAGCWVLIAESDLAADRRFNSMDLPRLWN